MSKTRPNTVQIVNPLPSGAQYTSHKSALQFVRRGLAVFEAGDTAIRFLHQDRLIELELSKGGNRGGGQFWWRPGKTGGMVQQIGSIVFPMARRRRKADTSI
jgi:hypothetical protein